MMAATALPAQWRLADLLAGICPVANPAPLTIAGLCLDSTRVHQGDLFFACAGGRTHGEVYIDAAIARGAVAVLREADTAGTEQRRGVPVYNVSGLRRLLGPIAERFYGSPSKQLFMVGVTGTNGKTSISQFIAQGFQHEAPCGVIGTLGNGLFGELQAGTHTTPDAISLHALLDSFRQRGARRVVMEVSSHGLEQGRVAGVTFDVAVLSNLSHEHLDYHGDMAAYGRAKQRLFQTPGLKHAVINRDDAFGRELLGSLPPQVRVVTYSLDPDCVEASIRATDLKLDDSGIAMQIRSAWGHGEIRAPLLGAFNAANLLAALAVLLVSDVSLHDALTRLAQVRQVPGRMERRGGERQPLVVIDYAHTPDALQHVLTALRGHTRKRLVCVFGCGGDRDNTKRPVMGRIAAALADQVIITDDNPRSEPSARIIEDILAGIVQRDSVTVLADRAAAIAAAIAAASPGDTVLVAGKGHEDYQLIGQQRLPFSDLHEVVKALAHYRGAS